jgi:hypothetical protein
MKTSVDGLVVLKEICVMHLFQISDRPADSSSSVTKSEKAVSVGT